MSEIYGKVRITNPYPFPNTSDIENRKGMLQSNLNAKLNSTKSARNVHTHHR